MTTDKGSDSVYRWTIRGLSLTALVLNAWLLWDQVKDTPEGEAMAAKVRKVGNRLTKPAKDAQLFRKHANAVIFEATTIVEETGGGDDADGD